MFNFHCSWGLEQRSNLATVVELETAAIWAQAHLIAKPRPCHRHTLVHLSHEFRITARHWQEDQLHPVASPAFLVIRQEPALPSSKWEWSQGSRALFKPRSRCLPTHSASEDQLFRRILFSEDSNPFDSHCLLAEPSIICSPFWLDPSSRKNKISSECWWPSNEADSGSSVGSSTWAFSHKFSLKDPRKVLFLLAASEPYKMAVVRPIHTHFETNYFYNCSMEALVL